MSIFNTESSSLVPERELYLPELLARLNYATESHSYKTERPEIKEKHYFLWTTVDINIDINKHETFHASDIPCENYHFSDAGSWSYWWLTFIPTL